MRRIRLAGVVVALCLSAIAFAPPALTATEPPRLHTPFPAPAAIVEPSDVTPQGTFDAGLTVADGTTVTGARILASTGDEPRQEVVPVTITPTERGTRVSAAVPEGSDRVEVVITDDTGAQHARWWRLAGSVPEATRIAGRSRTETAVEVSSQLYPGAGSATTAVLARADGFADALSGVPLAADLDGPVLLSWTDRLPEDTEAELQRVLPAGATVVLLGGEGALGPEVAARLRTLGFVPDRISGTDRYATSAAIAERLAPSTAAFVVSGATFPDALGASVVAAMHGAPILLTDPDTLPASIGDVVTSRGVDDVTIVGGTGAVSQAVQDDLEQRATSVVRVSGRSRFETAGAVARAFFPDPTGTTFASGENYPDALTGAVLAARQQEPLLLVARTAIPAGTYAAMAQMRTAGSAATFERLTVFGGAGAVHLDVLTNLRVTAQREPYGPQVLTTTPAATATVTYLGQVTLTLDRAVTLEHLHTTFDGWEVTSTVSQPDPRTVTVDLTAAFADLPVEQPTQVRMVLQGAGTDPDRGRADHVVSFTAVRPDPVYATTSGIELFLPSADVQLIGFHQSNHDGAQGQVERATSTARVVMESRGRGTSRTGAADIVSNPDLAVFAPVSGVVKRAGTYTLYCDHTDHYLVISPDAQPSWEVKLLHFEGLSVKAGERVEGGITQVGTRPRTLPFRSQVDDVSDARDWPHVHLEVVDPDVPDRPGGGC